jgi:hypothetical protein
MDHDWKDVGGHDPKHMQCRRCGAHGHKAWRPFDPYRIGPRYHPLELDDGADPDCDVQVVRSVISS